MSKIVLFLMSKSIDSLVLLESNVEKLKLLIVELKKENSKINSDLSSKDEMLLKQANDLKKWKEKQVLFLNFKSIKCP